MPAPFSFRVGCCLRRRQALKFAFRFYLNRRWRLVAVLLGVCTFGARHVGPAIDRIAATMPARRRRIHRRFSFGRDLRIIAPWRFYRLAGAHAHLL